jgi:hypothetical protein
MRKLIVGGLAAFALGLVGCAPSAEDVNQAREDCIAANMRLEQRMARIGENIGIHTDVTVMLRRSIDKCDGVSQ